MLFWLVTGRAPFESTALLSVAMAHVTEPPPPASRFAPVPASVDAVVLRALAKRPDDRYPTAAAMVEALASALAEVAMPARAGRVVRTAPMLPRPAALAPWPFVAPPPRAVRPPHPARRVPSKATPSRARVARSAALALLGAIAGFAAVAGLAALRAVVE
jgi:serine/threonine-protein kinase